MHDTWTFLTNHAHVLLCLVRDPSMRLRDLAASVGITERAVSRILHELADEGYVQIRREGRRNTYAVSLNQPLRHPVEQGATVCELVGLLVNREPARTP